MEEEKEEMVNSKVALEIFLRFLFYCAGGKKSSIGLFQPLTFLKVPYPSVVQFHIFQTSGLSGCEWRES